MGGEGGHPTEQFMEYPPVFVRIDRGRYCIPNPQVSVLKEIAVGKIAFDVHQVLEIYTIAMDYSAPKIENNPLLLHSSHQTLSL